MSLISDRTARRIAAERVPDATTFASTGAITPDLIAAVDAAIRRANGAGPAHLEELQHLRDYLKRAGTRGPQAGW
jgi:alkylhydroperoxidase family enzyme